MKSQIAVIFLALALVCSPLHSQKLKYTSDLTGVYEKPSKHGFMGYKLLPKNARHYFEDMDFIPMGSYMRGTANEYFKAEGYDSTLILSEEAAKVSLDAYFISNHEVTNAEYREFIIWVREKTAHDLSPMEAQDTSKLFFQLNLEGEEINIPVYPDTACWIQDFALSYNEPLSKFYFWHPAYDNYPVVGVSYYQAMAYCRWKSDRLNEEILIANKILNARSFSFTTFEYVTGSEEGMENVYLIYPEFRLPTEAEWEWAAKGGIDGSKKTNEELAYPWKSADSDRKSKLYEANFGNIIDRNGVLIKGYEDDGAMNTSEIKTYKANDYGLYDMLGNVAEWVLEDFPIGHYSIDRNLTRKNDPMKIVKGGSWRDGPVYLDLNVKSVYHGKKQHSWIGFRLIMPYDNNNYMVSRYIIPK